jgi:hypothetical protein
MSFLENTEIVFPVCVSYDRAADGDVWLLLDSDSPPNFLAESRDKKTAHDLKVAANRYHHQMAHS